VWNSAPGIRQRKKLTVFEDRMLRGIFNCKKDEITGWRHSNNEKLHDLNSSPDITFVIKPRTTRWTSHVAPVREKMNTYKHFVRKYEGKTHFKMCACLE
jgi:hypothetical protein